jgi:DNA-binding NarL/FixJ family response regulator
MQRRTVLLIRSHDCGWADLRLALGAIDDVHVVGEATDAPRGIELASQLQPDVIIAAAELDGMSLLPQLRDLHRTACPESKIIVLASHLNSDEFVAIDDVRVAGHLLWHGLSSETLRHSLAAAIGGDVVVVSHGVAKAFLEAQRRALRASPESPRLTPRERAVLGHLAQGHSREAIAVAERIGLRTVERTIARLERKLSAPTPFVLGMKAAQFGLLIDSAGGFPPLARRRPAT